MHNNIVIYKLVDGNDVLFRLREKQNMSILLFSNKTENYIKKQNIWVINDKKIK